MFWDNFKLVQTWKNESKRHIGCGASDKLAFIVSIMVNLVFLLVSASHFAKLNCLKAIHSIHRVIKLSNVALNRDVPSRACFKGFRYSSPDYGPDHHVPYGETSMVSMGLYFSKRCE